MTTEKQIVTWLRKAWSSYPVLIQPIETSTARGVPDLFVLADGRAWWLELKIGNRQLTRPQQRWLDQYSALGGLCGVLRNYGGPNFILVRQGHVLPSSMNSEELFFYLTGTSYEGMRT